MQGILKTYTTSKGLHHPKKADEACGLILIVTNRLHVITSVLKDSGSDIAQTTSTSVLRDGSSDGAQTTSTSVLRDGGSDGAQTTST